MEGEGEGWTSTEDSEEEERELEIALYSQIHFETCPEDAGVDNYHFMDNGNASFNVGVEEISLPLKRSVMEATGSENGVYDFLSHFKKQSKFRERVDDASTIYVTSSDDDDDASVEIISSDTIRDEPIYNRNETDDDECIVLDMSTSEIDERSHFVEGGNGVTSLGQKLPSSVNNSCNIPLSTFADKTLDAIIPISNSPKETHCEQSSVVVVPIVRDQSLSCDFNDDDDDVAILDAYVQLEESLPLSEFKEKPHSIPEGSESRKELKEKPHSIPEGSESRKELKEKPHSIPEKSESRKELKEKPHSIPEKSESRKELKEKPHSIPEKSESSKELKEKPHSIPEKNKNQISPNGKEKDPVLDAKDLKSSGAVSEPQDTSFTTAEKPKESCNILPFTITKTPVRIDRKPSSEDSDSLEKELQSSKVLEKKKLAGNKRPFQVESVKQDFLQFSENVKIFDKDVIRPKKKKLSKQEAAVKPRKPPVLLRKPPVVKVSYQQDSDTNTDYSDSDTCVSSTSTPKKAQLNRKEIGTRKTVREKSRDTLKKDSASSSSSDTENEGPRSVPTSKKTSKLNQKLKVKVQNQHVKENKQPTLIDGDVQAEESSSEESDSASSVSSHAADLDKNRRHNPALDFNIEGGVESLLKGQSGKTDGDKWQISDQDRYQVPAPKSRYFSPLTFTCRNCNKEGHKVADCPEPKKSVCIFCGKMGHVYHVCPDTICWNCNEPGHRFNDCKERPRNRRTMCDRCWMPGHFTEDCPDSWRQYHLTRGPDHTKIMTSSKKHSNPKVYCFNCGKEGHLGYECSASMMNSHTIPNYPFIAKYNTRGLKENRSTGRKKEQEAKEKKKKRHGQDFDRDENEYREETEKKDKGRTSHGSKRKGHSHDEERQTTSKSGKGKNHPKTLVVKVAKHHKEQSEEDGKKRRKERIVTQTTVFKFQNPASQDYEERDYSPPRKKRVSQGNKDNKNHLHPHGIPELPPLEDYYSEQYHHEYDIYGDDEFMDHQAFDGDVRWKDGQHTQLRKKGKSKQISAYGLPFSSPVNSRKQASQGNKDNKNRLPPQPLFEDYYSKLNHHDYDINGEDEFMNHQVFSNEWWKGDQSTQHKKRGKKKPSKKSTTSSKSMPNTDDNNSGNDEMYPEHQLHQYHHVKRGKQRESYESSRTQNSSHQRLQGASTSTGEVYASSGYHKPHAGREYHKPHYKSGYHRYNKKKKKSGFQMDSHFQTLSKSCRKK